jgi:hypothetical protein
VRPSPSSHPFALLIPQTSTVVDPSTLPLSVLESPSATKGISIPLSLRQYQSGTPCVYHLAFHPHFSVFFCLFSSFWFLEIPSFLPPTQSQWPRNRSPSRSPPRRLLRPPPPRPPLPLLSTPSHHLRRLPLPVCDATHCPSHASDHRYPLLTMRLQLPRRQRSQPLRPLLLRARLHQLPRRRRRRSSPSRTANSSTRAATSPSM